MFINYLKFIDFVCLYIRPYLFIFFLILFPSRRAQRMVSLIEVVQQSVRNRKAPNAVIVRVSSFIPTEFTHLGLLSRFLSCCDFFVHLNSSRKFKDNCNTQNFSCKKYIISKQQKVCLIWHNVFQSLKVMLTSGIFQRIP